MSASIDLAGWTLVHFVWQGAVLALLAGGVLRLLRAASPQCRYAVACAALAAMLAAPLVTAGVLSGTWSGAALAAIPGARPAIARIVPAPQAPAPPVSTAPAPSQQPVANATLVWNAPSLRAILPALVTAWLLGVSILLLRLAGGWWRVHRLRRGAVNEPVSTWQAAADTLARRLRLARPVFIVDSQRVSTPTVIGWIRPVVLLPVAALAALTPGQVEAILAHELAHVRRHDYLVNLLQTAAETLLFYHPGVWWLSSRIRTEREHCCDDVAVDVCGDPVAYATALTELAAWHLTQPALALAATGGPLLARVRRLLGAPPDGPRSASGIPIVAVALALVLVAGTIRGVSRAQSADPRTPAASDGRFGPPDVNRLVGFELFPTGAQWAVHDPRDARAWHVVMESPSERMAMLGFTGRSLIRLAHGLVEVPIVGAPEWLDHETFDVTALAGSASDPGELRAALRRLFEDRFGLATHIETRDFPVYALVRASADGSLGPGLRPSTTDCIRRDVRLRDLSSRFCGLEDGFTGWSAAGVTMGEFAQSIRARSPLAPDRPVVDRTGLSGTYDFDLRFGFLPIAAIGAHHEVVGRMLRPLGFRSLFTALPEQLGLRLEPSTAPFEVLVVDRIRRPVS